MSLQKSFSDYIKMEDLFHTRDPLLVAVSGGIDSVVLASLLRSAGYNFAIAHCNFQLRGEDSEADAAFVKKLASLYSVPFHIKNFETLAYTENKRSGIQEAARELRYEWFRQLLQEFNYKYLLTAHHADDNIETVLMNFFNGTGIRGLKGILPKSGRICRPLLFARKTELSSYAITNNLEHREDASNSSDKYRRNYFRHHLVPVMNDIIPGFFDNISDNISRFRSYNQFYQYAIQKELKKLIVEEKDHFKIPVLKLLKTPGYESVLFEILAALGFTAGQISDSVSLLHSDTGKYISSATHRVLRNRAWLLVSELSSNEHVPVVISENEKEVFFPGGILKISAGSPSTSVIPSSDLIAMLNMKEIIFPLILRRWKTGDYFYPLGMKGKKKLSRFFVDQKFSLLDKENTWVIESNQRIVWVVGKRIDDRFKIKPSTEMALRIEFNP